MQKKNQGERPAPQNEVSAADRDPTYPEILREDTERAMEIVRRRMVQYGCS